MGMMQSTDVFAAALLFAALFTDASLPVHNNHLRLIVVGDAGATHSLLRAGMLRVEKEHPVDAIVLSGDNFYPCGIHGVDDPQWTKITQHFGPVGVPILPVLGNHDYGDPQMQNGELITCGPTDTEAELQETARIPQWRFPARSYAMHSTLVDLIMLDTQPIASDFLEPFRGSATSLQEVQFFDEELRHSTAQWRIVVGHHTIYSSGEHGRANDSYRRNMRQLLPALDAKADLYICGHDHDLELIGNVNGGRPWFLISGAGSANDVMKPRRASEPPTIFPVPLQTFLGFAVVDITPQELSVTFYDHVGNQRGVPFTMSKR